ncbi:pyridoxamine kinase [Clostridium thermobutyricum]|uniref:Hydroxymethylpyrimidine/phosphomethylpyrimidine kinase n=1 Tax=Clostridium thermobutyricum DSM 4928 TaxID=1121339 RepID=A0A1V4SRU2_9CLOT|nr:pyridoxamine kinase [Clostridium thermobutyricum]OPX46503.1 hydroxymethylpyrimidine/phosphomethylpyrimidine kinase [Clostridium thermobutyricum DSM 4928]
MKKPVKRALIIHSLCAVGKASLTNILPVLSILGVEGCPIPSTILSSHTGGFKEIEKVEIGSFIEKSINSIEHNEINMDLALIGYLGDIKNLEFIKNYIRKNFEKEKIVLDPILGDNNKLYKGFSEEHVQNMRDLIKGCFLITPNLTEALYLTGRDVSLAKNMNDDLIRDICIDLRELGAKNIIITSVTTKKDKVGVCIFEEGKLYTAYSDKVEKSYPGTGDIFTSIVSGEVLKGKSIYESVKIAMDFLYETIKYSSNFNYDTKEGVLLEDNLYKLIEKR